MKQVPLFKEILELLEEPRMTMHGGTITCPADDPATLQFDESSECTSTTERRPFFNAETGVEEDSMPDLNVFNPCFNVITGQPLRRRPDGEINWDQPGLLFDPDERVAVSDPGNIPTELRTPIGALVACPRPDDSEDRFRFGDPCGERSIPAPAGSLVVSNPSGDSRRERLDGVRS